MFMVRLALAALTVGNWGIYGPAMELGAATPVRPGSEEYLHSEKYEIRRWNLADPASLAPFIRRLNELRHAEPALARNRPPRIQPIDDPHVLAWSRFDPLSGNRVVVVVNLAPEEPRGGRLELDPSTLGLEGVEAVTACDLFGGTVHAWHLAAVTIECTPEAPVRVFRLAPGDAAP
jgi:starch synthase (maltosyl-transferring)